MSNYVATVQPSITVHVEMNTLPCLDFEFVIKQRAHLIQNRPLASFQRETFQVEYAATLSRCPPAGSSVGISRIGTDRR